MKVIRSSVFGDTYLKLLLGFRIAMISGRFGGGKTLLGVWLAYWLKENGYVDKIVSNIPIKFNDDDGEDVKRSAILLDESWTYIQTKADIMNYSAYLRKLDSYLILPSVFDIHFRLSFFQCERVVNFQSWGIPIWWYQWRLRRNGAKKDSGSIFLINPQVMFGTYDTLYIPFDDGGISDRLEKTIDDWGQENEPKSARRHRVSRRDNGWGLDTSGDNIDASELVFAGQEFRDQVEESLRSISRTKQNK